MENKRIKNIILMKKTHRVCSTSMITEKEHHKFAQFSIGKEVIIA